MLQVMPAALTAALFFTLAAAALALSAYMLRRMIIPWMDSPGKEIELGNAGAAPGFRRMHVTAVSVNVLQWYSSCGASSLFRCNFNS